MKIQFDNVCFHAIITTLVVIVYLSSDDYYPWCCHAFQPPAERRHPNASFRSNPTLYSTSSPNANHQQIDPSIIDDLINFANELANVGHDTIMPYWRQKGVKVESKKEEGRSLSQTISPVTIADRSAEKAMRELIETRYPSHGIYGEEFGQVRVDADFVWVLDPIDGTKAFITGKPTWGILIGCLYRGFPVLGVIDQCILKERWVGSIGNPTLLNGEPVSVANPSVTSLCNATLYTTTPDMFRAGEEMEKFEGVRDASLRTLYGCDCYAYALVASGFGADAVVEADLGLYDYAAIVPVVQGAGGTITDWNGNALSLQNHENSKGRVVACSNTALHDEMLTTLSAAATDQERNQRDTGTKKFSKRGLLRHVFTFIAGVVLGVIGKSSKIL